jgi:hypothetical protein
MSVHLSSPVASTARSRATCLEAASAADSPTTLIANWIMRGVYR